MHRRADRQPSLAWLWRREARRLEAWDAEIISKARLTTVVAERDKVSLEEVLGDGEGRLEVVPFGLDVPEAVPRHQPEEKVVALTGNLGYFPTVDAARWFHASVWPALRRRHPDLTWLLAGSRPARAVRELTGEPGIQLVVEPPRLDELLTTSMVSLAPLFAGSGTPIKILEAMACGVPVVTTPAGRAGLDGVPGDALGVASRPEEFVETVDRLLDDAELRARQVVAAWQWLRERHHLPRVVDRFETLLQQAAG